MAAREDGSSFEPQTEAGPSTQPEIVAHPPSAPQFDTFWNFDFVIFQVEDALFRVLRHGFLLPGSPFEAMLVAPPEDPTNVEGASAGNPIVLHGTTADDFRAFLRVLYPLSRDKAVTSYDDWLGVLRLAHRWNYVKIRETAIMSLTPLLAAKTAEKIHLGNEFLVQDWLRLGLLDLVQKQKLEPDELAGPPFLFDWKTIAKIFCVREKAPGNNEDNFQEYYNFCNACRCGFWQKGGSAKQGKRLEDYFGAELAGARFFAEDDHDNAPALPT